MRELAREFRRSEGQARHETLPHGLSHVAHIIGPHTHRDVGWPVHHHGRPRRGPDYEWAVAWATAGITNSVLDELNSLSFN
jgi:hypothetical protein